MGRFRNRSTKANQCEILLRRSVQLLRIPPDTRGLPAKSLRLLSPVSRLYLDQLSSSPEVPRQEP